MRTEIPRRETELFVLRVACLRLDLVKPLVEKCSSVRPPDNAPSEPEVGGGAVVRRCRGAAAHWCGGAAVRRRRGVVARCGGAVRWRGASSQARGAVRAHPSPVRSFFSFAFCVRPVVRARMVAPGGAASATRPGRSCSRLSRCWSRGAVLWRGVVARCGGVGFRVRHVVQCACASTPGSGASSRTRSASGRLCGHGWWRRVEQRGAVRRCGGAAVRFAVWWPGVGVESGTWRPCPGGFSSCSASGRSYEHARRRRGPVAPRLRSRRVQRCRCPTAAAFRSAC